LTSIYFRAMADVKFIKEWAETTKAELDKMDKSDPHYKGKSDLYASLLAKATSAVAGATVTGASSSNGDLTRDQIAALRSAETALSSLEFNGRDMILTLNSLQRSRRSTTHTSKTTTHSPSTDYISSINISSVFC